jgi:hypothetical protein
VTDVTSIAMAPEQGERRVGMRNIPAVKANTVAGREVQVLKNQADVGGCLKNRFFGLEDEAQLQGAC